MAFCPLQKLKEETEEDIRKFEVLLCSQTNRIELRKMTVFLECDVRIWSNLHHLPGMEPVTIMGNLHSSDS